MKIIFAAGLGAVLMVIVGLMFMLMAVRTSAYDTCLDRAGSDWAEKLNWDIKHDQGRFGR